MNGACNMLVFILVSVNFLSSCFSGSWPCYGSSSNISPGSCSCNCWTSSSPSKRAGEVSGGCAIVSNGLILVPTSKKPRVGSRSKIECKYSSEKYQLKLHFFGRRVPFFWWTL